MKKAKKKKARSKARKSLLSKPTTRHQEVLFMMLKAKRPLSYYDFSKKLNNINAHKSREFWEKQGVVFNKIGIPFLNRFGRESVFYKFQLVNRRRANQIYKSNVAESRYEY